MVFVKAQQGVDAVAVIELAVVGVDSDGVVAKRGEEMGEGWR